jgi:hypothetical protein
VLPDADADSSHGSASPGGNGRNANNPLGNGARENGPRANDPMLGDPDLTDLLGVLHAHRWLVVAILALAASLGYGFGSRSSVESRADTRLLLVDPGEEGAVLPTSDPLPLEERQSAVVSRAESQRVRADVTEALKLGPGDIKSISAVAEEGESFVTITVTTVEGVDTGAIADRVAASVVEQQREAVGARSDALASELRQSAKDANADIATIDAQLEQLSRDIAVLQLQVNRNAGTDASVDPQVALAAKTDQANGLRSNRTALLSTQADFERRAREADVAGTVSSGGLEVYEPAGTVDTTRTLPPLQLGVLAASIALVVLVCAAYFVAYRTEAPRGTPAPATERGWGSRTAREQPQDDHEGGDEKIAEVDPRTRPRTVPAWGSRTARQQPQDDHEGGDEKIAEVDPRTRPRTLGRTDR